MAFLSGHLRQGRIGLGGAALRAARPGTAAAEPALTLREVDATFERIAGVTGAGSTAERTRLLGELLARATPAEQDFLVRLVYGELRQGALAGLMAEALAAAAELPAGRGAAGPDAGGRAAGGGPRRADGRPARPRPLPAPALPPAPADAGADRPPTSPRPWSGWARRRWS